MNRRRSTRTAVLTAQFLLVLVPHALRIDAVRAEEPKRTSGIQLTASSSGMARFRVRPPELVGRSVDAEGRPAIDLSLPRYGHEGRPGAPLLPSRTVLVAIPEGVTPIVSVSSVATEDLGSMLPSPIPTPRAWRGEDGVPFTSESLAIDDATYADSKVELHRLVEAGDPIYLRHHRVVPIRLRPYFYDGVRGHVVAATSFEVTVRWSGPERAWPGRGRSPRPTPLWEGILRDNILNWEEAREWSAPLRPARAAVSDDPILAGPEVRVEIGQTGFLRVRGDQLAAAGLAPSDVDRLAVYRKRYDEGTGSIRIDSLAAWVAEDPASTPGIFDGQDELVFYGLRLRDDPAAGDSLEAYSWYNVYWISYLDQPALRMAEKSPASTTNPPIMPADYGFPTFRHYEQDVIFWEETPLGSYDYFYYNGWWMNSARQDFEMLPIVPGTDVKLAAHITGRRRGVTNRIVDVILDGAVQGVVIGNDVPVPGEQVVVFSTARPASDFVVGTNSIRVAGRKPSAPNQVDQLQSCVRWFRVSYKARYRAANDRLAFNSASADGDTLTVIKGFTRNDPLLFDISDPDRPERLTGGQIWHDVGGGSYELRFRDVVSSGSPSGYEVLPPEDIPDVDPARLSLDVSSNIRGAAGPCKVVVVSDAMFLSQMQEWVRYRERQGYSVILVDVRDVFDEFNGGLFAPRAIKRLAQYGLDRWDTEVLWLIGESSEDQKRVEPESAINRVPTYSFNEYVTDIVENEVVTSDKWYGLMNNDFRKGQPNPDYLLDLIVARLSVDTPTQLGRYLGKLYEYETPEAGETWRKRILHLADDAWSWPDRGDNYRYSVIEEQFEAAERDLSTIVMNSPTATFERVDFFLADWTDVYHTNRPGNPTSVTPFISDTRADATPDLLDILSDGVLLWNVQCHANRFQLCHEFLFTSSNRYGLPDWTIERLRNTDKPFIIFGMGCHVNDYAVHREDNRATELRDCMGEHLIFSTGRTGAIASYASTGFEYLSANKRYSKVLWRNFFRNPLEYWDFKADSATVALKGHPSRWILGEIVTRSEIEEACNSPGSAGDNYTVGGNGTARRYHLLGDPLLMIDAGPPEILVTADGVTVQDGELLRSTTGGDSVTLHVRFQDEAAIDSVAILIDGVDVTASAGLAPVDDVGKSPARDYEGEFVHHLQTKFYDIDFLAFQAPDTSGTYTIESRLTLKVGISVTLSSGGREILPGGLAPPSGPFVFHVATPAKVGPADFEVFLNDETVPFSTSLPVAGDSLVWDLAYNGKLPPGRNSFQVLVAGIPNEFTVFVDSALRLSQLIVFPNPFSDRADFVFDVSQPSGGGLIRIFTSTGRLVRTLDVPPLALGNNVVHWDGRDERGDELASGVYLYRIELTGSGGSPSEFGKLVKIAGAGR